MPTKTGAKIRIIVLGTGPDADEAREIAAADADVAIAAKFTKTVTHLVIDDTVKSSEARVKKAGETGVPVLKLAELKELLVADAAVDPEPAAQAAETDTAETVAEPDTEPAVEAEPETAEPAAETEPVVEAEPTAEPEAVEAPATETTVETTVETTAETVTEPAADPAVETAAESETTADPDPAAESGSIETGSGSDSDSDKVVPAQAEAPEAERESEPEVDRIDEPAEERAERVEADDEAAKTAAKPGLMAKLKSIFGKTGARK